MGRKNISNSQPKVKATDFRLSAETGDFQNSGNIVRFPPPLREIFNLDRSVPVVQKSPPPKRRLEREDYGPFIRFNGNGDYEVPFGWYEVSWKYPTTLDTQSSHKVGETDLKKIDKLVKTTHYNITAQLHRLKFYEEEAIKDRKAENEKWEAERAAAEKRRRLGR